MILYYIFKFITGLFINVISLFVLPGLPDNVLTSAYEFLDLMFSNAQLVGLFVRLSSLKICATLLVSILVFVKVYNSFKTTKNIATGKS